MKGSMKAVVKAKPEPGFEMQNVSVPSIKPDEVLVKVQATSICGTDLHIYNWDDWSASRVKPPLIMGHEVCGEVVERGEMVSNHDIGDFVSLESHVICNNCAYCRTGLGHICENTKLIGVDRDGGFAEYIAIAAQNAWTNPKDLPLEIAVLQENFGNAVHTAFAVDLRAKKVLVTGCGPVGLMTIAVAKAIGARAIYATDVSLYRIDFARRMGADLALHAVDDPVIERPARLQHRTEQRLRTFERRYLVETDLRKIHHALLPLGCGPGPLPAAAGQADGAQPRREIK